MFRPNYHVSPQLLSIIKRITILVHELNKRRLPDVVMAQLQEEAATISTYASTSIEGNPLPLTEVRRILKNRPEHIRRSELEVLNYNRVLLALNAQTDHVFSEELILSIHHGLMQDLLPGHQSGRWRQEPVLVHDPRTGEVVYWPPDHEDVPALISELVTFVQEQRAGLDPMIVAGLVHKQLAIIHPFVDGNGRTARLVTKLLLAGMGLDTFNLFSFESYYNQDVSRYFGAVGVFGDYNEVVEKLDFTPWLEYFAEGILDELLRVEKLLTQRSASPETALESYHRAILDYIDEHGFITDKDYARLTERAKATRSLDFKKLIELGLIVRKGKGRATHYQRP